MSIKTYSVFGEVRWQIVPRLELAPGLRWSDETRTENPINGAGAPVAVPQPRVHAINLSPQVTLTYRPTDDLTAFAAWKEGFKSGSFVLATPVVAGTNNAFNEETVRGGEAGLKSRWLDRHLTINLSGYLYNYSGLQVGAITPAQNGQIVIQTVKCGCGAHLRCRLRRCLPPGASPGTGNDRSPCQTTGRMVLRLEHCRRVHTRASCSQWADLQRFPAVPERLVVTISYHG